MPALHHRAANEQTIVENNGPVEEGRLDPPFLLPLGPGCGASVMPFGKRGMVVGGSPTKTIKGKGLFIPRYRKELRYRLAKARRCHVGRDCKALPQRLQSVGLAKEHATE